MNRLFNYWFVRHASPLRPLRGLNPNDLTPDQLTQLQGNVDRINAAAGIRLTSVEELIGTFSPSREELADRLVEVQFQVWLRQIDTKAYWVKRMAK